jgi:hypothetical protein
MPVCKFPLTSCAWPDRTTPIFLSQSVSEPRCQGRSFLRLCTVSAPQVPSGPPSPLALSPFVHQSSWRWLFPVLPRRALGCQVSSQEVIFRCPFSKMAVMVCTSQGFCLQWAGIDVMLTCSEVTHVGVGRATFDFSGKTGLKIRVWKHCADQIQSPALASLS